MLEAERCGLGPHTVNRGLIGQHSRQHGVAAVHLGPQGGKRRTDRLAEPTADTDLVQLRLGLALLPSHRRPASESTAGNDVRPRRVANLMMTLLSSRSWLAILDPALVSENHLVWVIPATRVQADLSMAMSFTVDGW